MCCSIRVLKWLMYISCVLVLGVGSVLVWVGFSVQASQFIQVLQFSYSGFIVIACGGVLIGIAFIGILGAWKERTLFLTLFILFGVSIGVLLITFGGILLYIRSLSDRYLKDEASCISNFKTANDASIQAATVFCKLYCPCSLNSTSVDVHVPDIYRGSADNILECSPCESIQTYSKTEQDRLILWIKDNLGYSVNATNCAVTASQYQDAYFGKYTDYLMLVQWMEERFMCSGLCTAEKLFMFSDVNQGVPSGSCYALVNQWAQTNFENYGIISIALGSFQLFILFFAAALCCCSPKRLQKVDQDHKITNANADTTTKPISASLSTGNKGMENISESKSAVVNVNNKFSVGRFNAIRPKKMPIFQVK